MNNNKGGATEDKENLYALFFKYYAYWPWFVTSVCVCCLAMFLFICYVAPIYKISSSVLIKVSDSKQAPMSLNSETVTIGQDFGLFSMTNNFDNEVEILLSRTLVHKVVCDLNLYINVEEQKLWGYNVPLYKNTPINIYMTPQEADNLETEVKLHLKYLKNGKLYVESEYTYKDKYGKEQDVEEEKVFNSLPAIYPTPVGTISFKRNEAVEILSEDGNIDLMAYINAPTEIADNYLEHYLAIEPASKTTTIAKVEFRNTVKERGVDFINCLIDNYNKDANDEKNEVAQKSAAFIEERIDIINQELSTTETELVDFKQRSGLTDLSNDAQMALEESSKYEQQRIANATQIRLVNYIKSYIDDPENAYEVIPVNIGLEDVDLNTVIVRYNDLIIERKRLLRTSSPSNPAVVNVNSSLDAMFQNVQTTIQSVIRSLQITQEDLDRQTRKFENQINKVPQNEKEFLTISRQQEIKATLYTMLLQKREENAITLASTATNGRIIENALPEKIPVFPRKILFMIGAFIVGLGIPAVYVFSRDFFKYKIETSDEVKKITGVSNLCEIPYEKQPKGVVGPVVKRDRNGIMEEAFRKLRTHLLLMMTATDKVVLVTSSMPSEGKTFIASNLAVSLSLLKRKVLIVGLDIRNPQLSKVFNLSSVSLGITNYLENPEHVNLSDLIQHSDVYKGLDILISGTIPPNPTELLAGEKFSDTIKSLREYYDYIILDTAPVSLVTDTSIIGLAADVGVYVCRMDFSPKENLQDMHILREQCSLTKLICAINGVELNSRKHKYQYKYGKRYGYGSYHYGYGKA